MTDEAEQERARVVNPCTHACGHALEDAGSCTNTCIREQDHDGAHMCRLHNVYGI